MGLAERWFDELDECRKEVDRLTAEINRLRDVNTKLMGVCECQEAFVAYSSGTGSRGAMIEVFMQHGWNEGESSAEFTNRIRRAALAV